MKHIIIIGAGPAGLTAALELLRKHPDRYSVTILEAENTVGGISKTVLHHGNRMDLGGHRFFSKSQRVNEFWESLLPFEHRPESDKEKAMLLRKRISRIYFRGKFFDYPISLKPQTLKNMGLVTTLHAGFSYLFSCVFKRKEESLEDFYINRFGKVLYRLFFESYTEKLWGRHPSQIAADWGAQRVKGLSLRTLWSNPKTPAEQKETSLIEEFWYPKLGPGQLWEEAARQIRALGGNILLETKVTGFQQENKKITQVYYEHQNTSHALQADAVFSSMALKDLATALPELSQEERDIGESLPYRDFVTLGLLFPKAALLCPDPKAAALPDCWIYVQDKAVKAGRIQLFHNWSPYLVADPETAWIGMEFFCKENDSFWNLPEEDCAKLAKEELCRIGLLKQDTPLLDFHREQVKKAYPAYFDSYYQIDKLRLSLDRIENLYCIGRNGQHRYNNMDHSMLTAMKATELFVSGQADRSPLWNINAEKEYHESASH